MHKTIAVMFYATCTFLLIASFTMSNFSHSCIRCLFVISAVFILSGTAINPPHSLLVHYFLIASFDKCFFLNCFPCFLREQVGQ